jgi:small redox-active disulfide protein 2
MNVKILGSGCAKCNQLERRVKEMIEQNQIQDVVVEKVTDLNKMLDYGIMMTPGLIIDEEVKSAGAIPRDKQLLEWLLGG